MRPDEAKIFVAQPPARGRWAAWLLALAAGCAAAGFVYFQSDSSPTPRDVEAPGTVVVEKLTPPALTTLPATTPQRSPVPDRRAAINALNAHLLLHLPFSSSLEDHSPNNHAVKSSGAVSVSDGAAHFPGDAYLSYPYIPLDNRPFSFAVWIKTEGPVVGLGLLEQSDAGPGKHLHILMRDPDKPYFGFYLNDLRATESISSEMGWTHLAFQFTGSHQQIWINGRLSIERVSDPYRGTSGDTRIGKPPMWNNVPTGCFRGFMRDLRLYNIALTSAQIRLLAGLETSPSSTDAKPNETF